MLWLDASREYYKRTRDHDGQLLSLPEEWQRELVALGRLDDNINNGGYLQFFVDCGREYYVYASQVLKKAGADKAAAIVDACQALIDEHSPCEEGTPDNLMRLLPNKLIGREGKTLKEPGSVLPDSVLARISELSDEYMSYPDVSLSDDEGDLFEDYFRPFLKGT